MLNLFKNENRIKDPVCGMWVNIKKAKFKTEYNRKIYYFCSESCKMTFDENKPAFVAFDATSAGKGEVKK